MKLRPLAALALLAAPATLFCQPQSANNTPPSKKSRPAMQKDSPEQLSFADLQNMTVVVTLDPSRLPEDLGSGVWIGKNGYVATCQHVIASRPGPYAVALASTLFVSEGGLQVIAPTVKRFQVTVVAEDPTTDVAILKSLTPLDQIRTSSPVPGPSITPQTTIYARGATLKSTLPKFGETLTLAGFPLGGRTLIVRTAAATALGLDPENNPGPLSNRLRIGLFLPSLPGDSGGPVYDAEGNVVGLLQSSLLAPVFDSQHRPLSCFAQKLDPSNQPLHDPAGNPILETTLCLQSQGVSFAIPARFITDLAKKNNIDLK